MQKHLEIVKIKDLKSYGGNPRHNNKSAEMVAKSIKEFGYINPIIVDENNVILAGNTRFKAMQILGETEIEVLKVQGLTEAQKNGFVIADNRVGEYSKWNMSALERMLNNSEVDESILEEFGILSVKKTKKKIENMIFGE
jgi:site-specific DNA-methyltransferase (adenine-specific)